MRKPRFAKRPPNGQNNASYHNGRIVDGQPNDRANHEQNTGRQGRQPIRAAARLVSTRFRWSLNIVRNFTIFWVGGVGRQGRQPIRAAARLISIRFRWSLNIVRNFTIFWVGSTRAAGPPTNAICRSVDFNPLPLVDKLRWSLNIVRNVTIVENRSADGAVFLAIRDAVSLENRDAVCKIRTKRAIPGRCANRRRPIPFHVAKSRWWRRGPNRGKCA
jgi:hypothetical protein